MARGPHFKKLWFTPLKPEYFTAGSLLDYIVCYLDIIGSVRVVEKSTGSKAEVFCPLGGLNVLREVEDKMPIRFVDGIRGKVRTPPKHDRLSLVVMNIYRKIHGSFSLKTLLVMLAVWL